jgi:3D (Asp-Asp-Asp) domain-containing protein
MPQPAPEPLAPVPVTVGAGGAKPAEIYRNTYYFFPEEPIVPETGPTRTVFDANCQALRTVSQEFHDKLCVQGSGRLATGETVSFAKRGCECAAECPRTGHRICYELLESRAFPWGRGANGRPITPLRTVAVDSAEIPLGTVIYVPEMNGLRDLAGKPHDGCFLAEDRGSKVKGRHLDFFVGSAASGDAWNRAVPSNRGVHVVLRASQCEWLSATTPKLKTTRRKKR